MLQLDVSEREIRRSIANRDGDPRIYGWLLIVIGIGLVCYGLYLFLKRIKTYKLSKTNLEEYQRQVIRERDAAQAAAAASAREKARRPECPYCHSYNTSKITATAMSGVLGHQWHCKKCKSNF